MIINTTLHHEVRDGRLVQQRAYTWILKDDLDEHRARDDAAQRQRQRRQRGRRVAPRSGKMVRPPQALRFGKIM
jgi:hypothetical protein